MGRKWGQHFLRSQAVIDKIVEATRLDSTDVVLEIGPGEGVLTEPLCRVARRVHAVEIDTELAERLSGRGLSNLEIHHIDFLKADLQNTLGPDAQDSLVIAANLPYYITAPILECLFWIRPLKIKRAVLMMQDEVARRVCRPATREAGALTYIAGAYFEARYLFKVPPGCFAPPPKVDSAVVEFTPKSEFQDEKRSLASLYEKIVSTAFQARRKQLATSLKTLHPQAAEHLQRAGIEPSRRPETLLVEEFWRAARSWHHRE